MDNHKPIATKIDIKSLILTMKGMQNSDPVDIVALFPNLTYDEIVRIWEDPDRIPEQLITCKVIVASYR